MDFTDIAEGIPVESRPVAYDVAEYQRIVWNHPLQTNETRAVHLEHHMPGSPHSLVGQILPGRKL